jgi:peptide/nickel transport system permease protein
MTRYIIRRVLQAIPTLLGITFISFMLISAVPGGAAAAIIGNNPKLTQEQKLSEIHRLGLDQPVMVQYVNWLVHALQLDFGQSFEGHRPVVDELKERIAATLELGITSLLIGLLIGVPVGIWAAVRQGSVFDNVSRVLAVVVSAIPIFWLGLVMILIFGSWLHLLPMGGRTSATLTTLTGVDGLIDRLRHIILPAIILSLGFVAGYSRYMRASTLEVSRQDYIRTAQSKGLTSRVVWFTHAARNALIPLCTFLGPAITGLLGGALITEQIFSWPGIGQWTIQAVNSLDIPVVMITVLIGAVGTVTGYLLSDILYAVVDPRIRYS